MIAEKLDSMLNVMQIEDVHDALFSIRGTYFSVIDSHSATKSRADTCSPPVHLNGLRDVFVWICLFCTHHVTQARLLLVQYI